MKTYILTHFFNEEYLLPWWLNHHKKIFDHGVLIDYGSTDNSVNIIKEICPNWLIVPSVNEVFQSDLIDKEVMHWENRIDGWRIVLNITEFLVGDISNKLIESRQRLQYLIPSVSFFDWDPNGKLDESKELWAQKTHGVSYEVDFHNLPGRWSRSLHNFNDIKYPIGRHFNHGYNCTNPLIFHYANCISSPEMLARRLQIQTKMSASDIRENKGYQHSNFGRGLTVDGVKSYNDSHGHKVFDCYKFINEVTNTSNPNNQTFY
jgi:hypothetical protein